VVGAPKAHIKLRLDNLGRMSDSGTQATVMAWAAAREIRRAERQDPG